MPITKRQAKKLARRITLQLQDASLCDAAGHLLVHQGYPPLAAESWTEAAELRAGAARLLKRARARSKTSKAVRYYMKHPSAEERAIIEGMPTKATV